MEIGRAGSAIRRSGPREAGVPKGSVHAPRRNSAMSARNAWLHFRSTMQVDCPTSRVPPPPASHPGPHKVILAQIASVCTGSLPPAPARPPGPRLCVGTPENYSVADVAKVFGENYYLSMGDVLN